VRSALPAATKGPQLAKTAIDIRALARILLQEMTGFE
jgi:hypothetical protein